MKSATGFATATEAHPELAADAVTQALERSSSDVAQNILLFLTPHYARHAQAAITAAARAGHCLQVTGCTTPGVFTESAWSLEQPAAAALVMNGNISLATPAADSSQPRLSMAMPDAIEQQWLRATRPRYGTLATGNEDHAVGATWGHGKWMVEGRVECEFRNAQVELAVSRGMRAISAALEIDDVDGYEVLLIDDRRPLDTLQQYLPPEIREHGQLPLAMIFAAVIDADTSLEKAVSEGQYALIPIISVNGQDGTITLGASLSPGMRMFWALRHPQTAETELGRGIEAIAARNAGEPEFAVMFSCIGRGSYFYGGRDHDLDLLATRYPGMPIIGCYSGGEIAPLPHGNSVLSYSTVAALAYSLPNDVQS